MKLARHLERRLERLMDGMAARLFGGRIQPVELANRLVREADLAVVDGPAGPTIPNVFLVGVNPAELEPGESLAAVTHELAMAVEETAVERGWRLEGPAEVEMQADDRVPSGTLACETAVRPGALPTWAWLLEARGVRRLPLAHVRTVIGRDDEADVRLEERQVSRRHAVIWREGGGVMTADLGSANGTYLNGGRLAGPSPLHDGDGLAFGPATFTFRPA